MKKEEEISIDNLIEGVIYIAESPGGREYIFICTDKNKPFKTYINCYLKEVRTDGTGDINIKSNNFAQRYRMALPNEKELYLLSMKEGKYTEPSIQPQFYQIY